MTSATYDTILWGMAALAPFVFAVLFFVKAPYGRYTSASWGPLVGRRVGWITMESVPALVVAGYFALGDRHDNAVAIVFLAFWLLHYVNRAFVFPFRMRGSGKQMPIVVVLMAVAFNGANGYLQGRYLFDLGPLLSTGWLADPRFLLGSALFATGFAINHHSDAVLRRLRAPGERGYKIPRGGLYRWVSCPNYFGEIVEWVGWAVLTWSPPGLVFAVWTAANLVPRARSHHAWYREEFDNYPPERKAVIPLVY